MQTQQRKIPLRGANGKYITWQEMLPLYEAELQHFKAHLDSLKTATGQPAVAAQPLEPAAVQLTTTPGAYTLDSAAHPFTDTTLTILAATPILKNLSRILQSAADQRKQGTKITFTCTEPVDLLI